MTVSACVRVYVCVCERERERERRERERESVCVWLWECLWCEVRTKRKNVRLVWKGRRKT